MATQSKKTQAKSHASAKLSSTLSGRPRQSTLSSGASSARQGGETVVKLGTEAVREFFSSGAEEAQKVQEKAFAFSRENAENFARSADSATKSLSEVITLGRENVEACVECGNITTNLVKEFTGEVIRTVNETFAQNVEISKRLFNCRTVNDLFEVQSLLLRTNLEALFTESSRFSELFFRYASEAAEPINERVTDATERLSKSFTG